MSSPQSKTKQVLSDHKRIGKRFIPPFVNQFGRLNEVRWLDGPLPELLWLALLNRTHGFERGAELGLVVSRAAAATAPVDAAGKKIWFAPASSFSTLSEQQQQVVADDIRTRGQMDPVRAALAPLVALYPRCPLRFLFAENPPAPKPEYIPELKEALVPLFDKTTRPATLMQANAVYIAIVTDILRVAASTSLANFPAVSGYPDTEESLQIGAAVRAAISGFFGATCIIPSAWPGYFWNRGVEIDPCLLAFGDSHG